MPSKFWNSMESLTSAITRKASESVPPGTYLTDTSLTNNPSCAATLTARTWQNLVVLTNIFPITNAKEYRSAWQLQRCIAKGPLRAKSVVVQIFKSSVVQDLRVRTLLEGSMLTSATKPVSTRECPPPARGLRGTLSVSSSWYYTILKL